MTQRFTICVFCGKAMEHYECQNLETHFCFTGSSFGLSDEFIEATRSLALKYTCAAGHLSMAEEPEG